MNRLILVLLLGCLSFAAYGQDKKSKTKRRNKVEQNIEANSSNQRREIKYILHNPRLSNTRLSEFYNLDVTDIPKNYKRILRSHPCWKVTRFAYANIYDDEYYIEKDIYGGEEYPYHNTFAFSRRGYWRYGVNGMAAGLPPINNTIPSVESDYQLYNNTEFPLEVLMYGGGNKFVVGYQSYDKDGNPKNTDSCLTYLIEPATRKRLKEAKSLTKKAKKMAKYNKDVYTFLRGGFISENMNNALNYLLGD